MKKKRFLMKSILFCMFSMGIACMFPIANVNVQQKLLGAENHLLELEKKNMEVSVSLLDAQTSKRVLGVDYLQREIQPVCLTIHNGTSYSYLIRPSQIDLPLLDVKKMLDKEGRVGRIGRSIFWRIAGFFFWPASIPGTIDSVLSSKAQSKFVRAVHAKALKEEAIAPYSVVHRIFFVSNKALKDFSITFANTETTETLRCEVALYQT
jgi:hypothetical protein